MLRACIVHLVKNYLFIKDCKTVFYTDLCWVMSNDGSHIGGRTWVKLNIKLIHKIKTTNTKLT